jgi:Holliday junction resolvase RusA-like endonuclease
MQVSGWLKKSAGPFVLRMDVYRSEKRGDLDNYIKNVDALTKAGVWSDDAAVEEIHARLFVDRVKPRLEVTVEARS